MAIIWIKIYKKFNQTQTTPTNSMKMECKKEIPVSQQFLQCLFVNEQKPLLDALASMNQQPWIENIKSPKWSFQVLSYIREPRWKKKPYYSISHLKVQCEQESSAH